MPHKVSGKASGEINRVEEKFEANRKGLVTGQVKVFIPDGEFPSKIRPHGSRHPRFASLFLVTSSFTRVKAGAFWEASYSYEGTVLDSLPDATYELRSSLSEDPIESHPDFESVLAGTPSEPKNGAIFIDPETDRISKDNDTGVFREFGAGSSKAGVDSYLVPAAEWVETRYTRLRPTGIEAVGTISEPNGPNPGLGSRTWLVWSQEHRQRGSLWEVTTSWRMSGPGGWDEDIYAAED